MSAMRSLRGIAVPAAFCGALGSVVFAAPRAEAAGPYGVDAHIDGVPGGTYTAAAFQFNADAFEVTFTHTADASSVALMGLQKSRTEVATALVHETLNGTAVVTLQMSGVRVADVHEGGSVNNANGPEETVTLHVKQVIYTYQAVTPTGQRLGAPVTITYQRGDTR
jgi:hypothetical protein